MFNTIIIMIRHQRRRAITRASRQRRHFGYTTTHRKVTSHQFINNRHRILLPLDGRPLRHRHFTAIINLHKNTINISILRHTTRRSNIFSNHFRTFLMFTTVTTTKNRFLHLTSVHMARCTTRHHNFTPLHIFNKFGSSRHHTLTSSGATAIKRRQTTLFTNQRINLTRHTGTIRRMVERFINRRFSNTTGHRISFTTLSNPMNTTGYRNTNNAHVKVNKGIIASPRSLNRILDLLVSPPHRQQAHQHQTHRRSVRVSTPNLVRTITNTLRLITIDTMFINTRRWSTTHVDGINQNRTYVLRNLPNGMVNRRTLP